MGNKIGVALSGGGALGAYQVGVLKAYVEDVGRLDVLAGSSVGALNMLVLASAPSLEEGVKRLERIWVEEAPALLRLTLALASYARLGDNLAAFVLKRVAGDKALGLERGVMSQNELRTLLARVGRSPGVLPVAVRWNGSIRRRRNRRQTAAPRRDAGRSAGGRKVRSGLRVAPRRRISLEQG